ncbi:PAS domain-containing protein [Suillus clintonianus]|uniref:PAS domain-containing protein n=1 Tax=Suillus clintonianus TaxID=1904413 RepID=UPI001B880247|nr:PAS domain-containing protein [Suillus clintonianus]KAG2143092.1 PAS domain-containing protein [Suillus clintonianus]
MYNGPPILAPGGGAEVLPAGLLDSSSSYASSWFANNGFAPFHSSSQSRPHASVEATSGASNAQSSTCYDAYSNVPHSIPYPQVDYSHQPPLPPIQTTAFTAADILKFNATASFSAPSPLGLPVYSSSGFDLLSLLSRVVSRPHPNIVLGPVDSSCSFTVVDVRRHDCPIIYASPTFYRLTGYTEHEVLGRNCRFLQSPDGNVQKGEERRFVAPDAVAHLKKSLSADKECQTSIINYRKGGQAFINLVTVIPLRGGISNRPEEADEIVYHVGFQVDLTEQPNAILQKLRDGSYIVNYTVGAGAPVPSPLGPPTRGRLTLPSNSVLSKDLRSLITDSKFTSSVPLSTSVNIPPSTATPDKPDTHDGNQLIHMLLLEKSPDFIVVLSLKGAFLYVAPSVRLVLGYEPEELVGKSISDYCHPADLVPLMRELKESSITPNTPTADSTSPIPPGSPNLASQPKTVDLLFRARAKSFAYAWIECRGRLHVEPGKGRKAIILSGRGKWMPSLSWRSISRAGGLGEQEIWGMVSTNGTVLVTSASVRDMLGWSVGEVIGKSLGAMVIGGDRGHVEAAIQRANGDDAQVRGHAEGEPSAMVCTMLRKDRSTVHVRLVIYRPPAPTPTSTPSQTPSPSPAHQLVIQITVLSTSSSSNTLIHAEASDVFEELDTARGSSWQYELQQLRFANQRLCEEVDALEVRGPEYHQEQQHQQQHQHQQQQHQQQHHQQQHPTLVHPRDNADWTTLIGSHTSSALSSSLLHMNPAIHIPASTSLKRTWHSEDGPG